MFQKVATIMTMQLFLIILLACTYQTSRYEPKPENKIILRLAETQSADYPSIVGVKEFARLVDERTKGRIQVRVYEGGQLGSETNVIEQVQYGGIDLARVSMAHIAEYSKGLNVLMTPFLYEDSQHMWSVLESEIGQEYLETLTREKFVGLCWYETGACYLYNAKHPIESVADLKVLKIRVPQSQLMMDIISNFGGSPIPMQLKEVYSALQSNFIDGVQDDLVTYYMSRHYELAKYITDTEHVRIPDILIASRMTMMQLSKNDQELIQKAAKDSVKVQREAWAKKEREAWEAIRKANVKVNFLKKEEKELLRKAVVLLYDQFSEEDRNHIAKIKKMK